LSPTVSDIAVKIMVEVLSVLALATKQISQGRLKKFAKKLLRKRDAEAILERLDRLTQEEARVIAAHTLGVVQEVSDNLKVVMDGAYNFLSVGRIDVCRTVHSSTADYEYQIRFRMRLRR